MHFPSFGNILSQTVILVYTHHNIQVLDGGAGGALAQIIKLCCYDRLRFVTADKDVQVIVPTTLLLPRQPPFSTPSPITGITWMFF